MTGGYHNGWYNKQLATQIMLYGPAALALVSAKHDNTKCNKMGHTGTWELVRHFILIKKSTLWL